MKNLTRGTVFGVLVLALGATACGGDSGTTDDVVVSPDAKGDNGTTNNDVIGGGDTANPWDLAAVDPGTTGGDTVVPVGDTAVDSEPGQPYDDTLVPLDVTQEGLTVLEVVTGDTATSDTSGGDCQSCITGSCGSQVAACQNDSNCNGLLGCLGNCATGDTACQQQCGSQYQAGVTLYNAAAQCAQSYCASACGGTTTDSGPTGDTSGGDCQGCISGSCGSQVTACQNDSNCNGLLGCLNNCAQGDTACEQQCGSQYQAGVTLYNAAAQCVQDNCATQCGGGGTGQDCGNVTEAGCCNGTVLSYCDPQTQQLVTGDCAGNPSCGWDPNNGWYDCGTAGGADPSGAAPRACQ